jgi:hypothetical protein
MCDGGDIGGFDGGGGGRSSSSGVGGDLSSLGCGCIGCFFLSIVLVIGGLVLLVAWGTQDVM